MRCKLLFKDGITRPAAAVSAPIVIESALVECASEGVCVRAPQKDYMVGTSRRAEMATFAYLTGVAPILGECVCGTEAGKKGQKSQPVSSVLKLPSTRRMWVVFKQGSLESFDKIIIRVVIDEAGN